MKAVLVGTGTWGRNHARALKELGVLGAVYDINQEVAASVSSEYGCEPLKSLDSDELRGYDFAVVATPASTHVDVVLRLLSLGLDVLVEKPISTSYDGALKMYEEAKRRGAVLGVGYIELFNPVVKKVIEELKSSRALSASAFRLNSRPSRISDVGVVLDTMIHDINIADVLLEGARLASKAVIYDDEGRDVFASAYLEGDGGKGISITAAWTPGIKFRKWVAATEKKALEADLASKRFSVKEGERETSLEYGGVNALLEEDKHFMESVKLRSDPVNSAEVALKDMLLVKGILGA